MYNDAIKVILDASVETGIGMDRILGKRRLRGLVKVRRHIIKKIRETTDLSLSEIGMLMGNRDHTTILYYLKT